VSVFAFGRRNFCSVFDVFAVYRNVNGIPCVSSTPVATYETPFAKTVVEPDVQNVYAVPFTVEVNCVYLSMVTDAGASVGVTVILTFAFAPVDDCGVYPNIDAFETTESLNCAESKKDSLASMFT